jgi:hypothetical protein
MLVGVGGPARVDAPPAPAPGRFPCRRLRWRFSQARKALRRSRVALRKGVALRIGARHLRCGEAMVGGGDSEPLMGARLGGGSATAST